MAAVLIQLAAPHPGHAIRAPLWLYFGVFAFNLFAIMRGGLQKAPFECPIEAGRVLVTNGMRDLLDAQVAVCEKIGGSQESSFAQPLAKTNARLLFEQAL